MTPMPTGGFAIWLTGLPSSGKSAVAHELKRLLAEHGLSAQILDSDELRERLTPHPTYSDEERQWFYETIVFLTALLTVNGVNVLIAATGPRRKHRDRARLQIMRFAEVHIDCPVALCRRRDPKGLWQRAASGEIKTLPGAGLPYEPPLAPDLRLDTSTMTIKEAGQHVFDELRKTGFFNPL